MRKLFVLAFSLAVLAGCVSTPIGRQDTTVGTGQWLHDLWRSYQKTSFANQEEAAQSCIYTGLVSGAAQVMIDAGWISSEDKTYGQMAAVVGKYLDNHPEQWNLSAETLIYRSLYAVWPGNVAAPYQ